MTDTTKSVLTDMQSNETLADYAARVKQERDEAVQNLSEVKRKNHCQSIQLNDYAEEVKTMQAHVERLVYRLEQATHCISKNMTGDVVLSFLEMAKQTMNEAPRQSLDYVKIEAARSCIPRYRDPYTNNGDRRADGEQRIGWNQCRSEMERNAQQFKNESDARRDRP